MSKLPNLVPVTDLRQDATGVLNVLAWSIVIVYAFFAIGSGYLLAKEKPFGRTPAQSVA